MKLIKKCAKTDYIKEIIMYKIVDFSHKLMTDHLNSLNKPFINVVDATCGMGNDTLFLAQLLQKRGHVDTYDIQPIAIETTKEKAATAKLTNITFHLQSHELIDQKNIDLVIYNLGYLPTQDKTITTLVTSTMQSITKMIHLLSISKDMLLIVVVYPGHLEGKKESIQLDNYFHSLSNKQFLVSRYENVNRLNAPYLYSVCMEKR